MLPCLRTTRIVLNLMFFAWDSTATSQKTTEVLIDPQKYESNELEIMTIQENTIEIEGIEVWEFDIDRLDVN